MNSSATTVITNYALEVPHHLTSRKLRLVNSDYIATQEYDINPCDCALKGLLLSIRHSSLSSTKSVASTFTPHYARRNIIAEPAMYDRILTFADLLTPNKCFAVLLRTVSDSNRAFKHCKNNIAVGRIFILIEPAPVQQMLSPGLPKVTLRGLSGQMLILQDTQEYVPHPICEPEAGHTMYCIFKNTKVLFHYALVDTVTVSCRGSLCDKQQKMADQKHSCGCLLNVPSIAQTNYVLEMSLGLQIPDWYAAIC